MRRHFDLPYGHSSIPIGLFSGHLLPGMWDQGRFGDRRTPLGRNFDRRRERLCDTFENYWQSADSSAATRRSVKAEHELSVRIETRCTTIDRLEWCR